MELLNDMALFVEVAKTMSFTRAAESLGIPGSTLSRRISQLEKNIGLRLLHRTTRKVEMTEEGQIYYERCKRIVEEARQAHDQLGELLKQPQGKLKVSMPVDFAAIFISPLLSEFCEIYPGIDFELDLTPRHADLITENIDIAIRIGQPPDSNLFARKLMQLTGQLFASPGYIENKKIGHPREIERHQCIGFVKKNQWILQRAQETSVVRCQGRYMLNSVGLMKQLALQHQGIIFVPEPAVAAELEAKTLVAILPEWLGEPVPVYAMTETRLLPAKTQLFLDFLYKKLGANAKTPPALPSEQPVT